MPLIVVSTAVTQCMFGAAPSCVLAFDPGLLCHKKPVVVIKDFIPFLNILPFGVCASPKHPGFPYSPPCTPVTTNPWTPGSSTTTFRGSKIVHQQCKLTCQFAAAPNSISIANPGQPTDTVNS